MYFRFDAFLFVLCLLPLVVHCRCFIRSHRYTIYFTYTQTLNRPHAYIAFIKLQSRIIFRSSQFSMCVVHNFNFLPSYAHFDLLSSHHYPFSFFPIEKWGDIFVRCNNIFNDILLYENAFYCDETMLPVCRISLFG